MRTTFTQSLADLKHGAVRYGRFYPENYLMAVFDDLYERQKSAYRFMDRGWEMEDLIAFEGSDLLELQEDLEANRTLLETVISKFADRDSVYQECLRLARIGSSKFLLIYTPTHDHRKRARQILANSAVLAQMFEPMSYRKLAGDS